MNNVKIKIIGFQKKLIERNIVAFATCDLNNKPNVIAVTYCKVVGDSQILVTDNFMNKTRKNLLVNNKVSLAVWNKDGEEGYQLKGTAQYLTSGKYKKTVDEMEINKGLAHKAAVLVTVEEVYNLVKW